MASTYRGAWRSRRMSEQVTKKQHFVPTFYLRQFSDDKEFVKVLDVRGRKILKARPYKSICYEDFFYGLKTGERDEVSQVFEKWFGSIENQFGKRLPAILERMAARQLDDTDFHDIANFMSLQWQRTKAFRDRINRMQEQVTWNVMRIAMSIPGYLENVAKEQGKQLSKEELQQIADTATPEHYKLTFDNSTHLRLIDENSVRGFHNLFYYKRWNVIAASSKWKFITTDNPVSEWWPNTGIMGATFSQRKHYFAFTPDFLIESVMPEDNRPPIEQLATERVQYSTATEDETMMYNFVLGNFCSRYGYSPGRVEFDEMLAQMESPAAAKRMYDERY